MIKRDLFSLWTHDGQAVGLVNGPARLDVLPLKSQAGQIGFHPKNRPDLFALVSISQALINERYNISALLFGISETKSGSFILIDLNTGLLVDVLGESELKKEIFEYKDNYLCDHNNKNNKKRLINSYILCINLVDTLLNGNIRHSTIRKCVDFSPLLISAIAPALKLSTLHRYVIELNKKKNFLFFKNNFPEFKISILGLSESIAQNHANFTEIFRSIFSKKNEKSASLCIDRNLDCLSDIWNSAEFKSFPFRCLHASRQMVRPSKTLCLVATARNEGLYILEWLAYHRSIGFEKVFLYTNDNDDGSNELLRALSEAGEIMWIENMLSPGGNAQNKAYAHALTLNQGILDYRWALFIDMDEFFCFDRDLYLNAGDFAESEKFNLADSVVLNWRHYGPSGQAHWKDDFIANRFPHAIEDVNQYNKSLIRPSRFVCAEPHFPIMLRNINPAVYAADGSIHEAAEGIGNSSISKNPIASHAWINHYFHKSAEEYLSKFSRNRGNYPTVEGLDKSALTPPFIMHFTHYFTKNVGQKPSLLECAPKFLQEYDRILNLPNVRESFETVKSVYSTRFRELVNVFRNAQSVKDAGVHGKQFIKIVGG